MGKEKAKRSGIIAVIFLIAAAFGIRAVKSGIFFTEHPKNEFSASVEDTYNKYELYNGTDTDQSYVTMQDGEEYRRKFSGTGSPSERADSRKAIKPNEGASFFAEYEISTKKGNLNRCIDRNFVKTEERQYPRKTLDPKDGKKI